MVLKFLWIFTTLGILQVKTHLVSNGYAIENFGSSYTAHVVNYFAPPLAKVVTPLAAVPVAAPASVVSFVARAPIVATGPAAPIVAPSTVVSAHGVLAAPATPVLTAQSVPVFAAHAAPALAAPITAPAAPLLAAPAAAPAPVVKAAIPAAPAFAAVPTYAASAVFTPYASYVAPLTSTAFSDIHKFLPATTKLASNIGGATTLARAQPLPNTPTTLPAAPARFGTPAPVPGPGSAVSSLPQPVTRQLPSSPPTVTGRPVFSSSPILHATPVRPTSFRSPGVPPNQGVTPVSYNTNQEIPPNPITNQGIPQNQFNANQDQINNNQDSIEIRRPENPTPPVNGRNIPNLFTSAEESGSPESTENLSFNSQSAKVPSRLYTEADIRPAVAAARTLMGSSGEVRNPTPENSNESISAVIADFIRAGVQENRSNSPQKSAPISQTFKQTMSNYVPAASGQDTQNIMAMRRAGPERTAA